MAANPSKQQIDRLGIRLREAAPTETDLRALEAYRQSFAVAYEAVMPRIREADLPGELAGRPTKSTAAIVEKLRRESIRLTQIQDIAGCRLIVDDILRQNPTLGALRALFPSGIVIDRRANPSHGYRAIHLIVRYVGRPVEIQLRTRLQDLWAQLSEKLSDTIDSSIKYGGGGDSIRTVLDRTSLQGQLVEDAEVELFRVEGGQSNGGQAAEMARRHLAEEQRGLQDLLREMIALVGD